MKPIVNVYCDESCHLERDASKVMVVGAVWCPKDKAREVAVRLRELKVLHNLSPKFELKWSKASLKKLKYYLAVLDYFFENPDLHFRALVIPDKSKLRHSEFGGDHNTFYYKMMFYLLVRVVDPSKTHHIYLDIKDTRSADKEAQLHQVLCNDRYDFNREVIERLQTVQSHEVEQMQLADLLIGAVCYANRGLDTSEAKLRIIEGLRARAKYSLTRTTYLGENKTNIFVWTAREAP